MTGGTATAGTVREVATWAMSLSGHGAWEQIQSNLFSRSIQFKNVTYLAPSLSRLLQAPGAHRLKVVWAGIRVFETDHQTKSFRLTQDGLELLLPHITRQRAHLPFEDLVHLLENPCHPTPMSYLSAEAQRIAAEIPMGTCVLLPIGAEKMNPVVAVAAQKLMSPPALAVHFAKSRGREHAPKAAAEMLKSRLERALR
ncbi:hypothetical protein CYMTET_34245 [Cymbomonas tetramitiformis]|uniref:RNA cytosine-C(5)-methyltransferase NSUN2-like pre-PUA domain-containing protein n=1 Tax=Cymbomonas tetramitiformis TaxID=36881 RepID=A0AAE0FBG3_9CHLO|nr:hypothetical protein CYMTET_34245 [Cymbomonas tetramitiformis]